MFFYFHKNIEKSNQTVVVPDPIDDLSVGLKVGTLAIDHSLSEVPRKVVSVSKVPGSETLLKKL